MYIYFFNHYLFDKCNIMSANMPYCNNNNTHFKSMIQDICNKKQQQEIHNNNYNSSFPYE